MLQICTVMLLLLLMMMMMWMMMMVMVMVMLCSAVEVGVDMLELDCHMTKDGEVVVCHDDNLERVTGLPVRISDTLLKVSTACFVKFHMSIQILCI